MSHAIARQSPPPIAAPLIAPITGWCMSRSDKITSSKTLSARLAIVGTVNGNRNWLRENQDGESSLAPTTAPALPAQPALEDDSAEPVELVPVNTDDALELGDAVEQEGAVANLDGWSDFFDAADAAVNLDLDSAAGEEPRSD